MWNDPVLIYDESHYNRHDAVQCRDGGCVAAVIKAGDGDWATSPTLDLLAQRKIAIGMPFGSYWWIDPRRSARAHVNRILRVIKPYPIKFIALDVEQYWADWAQWWKWLKDDSIKLTRIRPDIIDNCTHEVYRLLVATLDIPVLIYTGMWFVNEYSPSMKTWLPKVFNWLAEYPRINLPSVTTWEMIKTNLPAHHPQKPSIYSPEAVMWQFASRFRPPGALNDQGRPGGIDLNMIERADLLKLGIEPGSVPPQPPQPPQPPVKTGKVTATWLKLRATPGGLVIAYMPKGTTVEIIDSFPPWYRVCYGNLEGWAGKAHIRLS